MHGGLAVALSISFLRKRKPFIALLQFVQFYQICGAFVQVTFNRLLWPQLRLQT